METFNIKLQGQEQNIYFLGDVHIGNCNHDEPAFKAAVKIVEQDPIGHWFGMADYIDAITHFDSKRFDPATIDPKYRIKDLKNLPIIQMDSFYNIVEPIKDKCLGLLIGNHEAAYAKYNSCDVYDHLLNKMSDGDKARKKELTLGYLAVGNISLNYGEEDKNKSRTNFTMALNHGDGGTGFLPGYPISKCYELFRYYLTQINVMGHIHQLYYDDGKYIDFNEYSKSIRKVRRCFGISGQFLTTYRDGTANYFEGKGRKEGDIGMLRIKLSFTANSKTRPFLQKFIEGKKIVLG